MLYRKSVFYSYVIKNLDKTVKTENDRGIERILVFYTSFNRTLYCDWCDRAGVTLFHRGLPETEDQLKALLPADNEATLVVVDDLEVSSIFGGWLLLSSVRCYRIKRGFPKSCSRCSPSGLIIGTSAFSTLNTAFSV